MREQGRARSAPAPGLRDGAASARTASTITTSTTSPGRGAGTWSGSLADLQEAGDCGLKLRRGDGATVVAGHYDVPAVSQGARERLGGVVVAVVGPGQHERGHRDAGEVRHRGVDERVEHLDQRDRVAPAGGDPVFHRLFRGAGAERAEV